MPVFVSKADQKVRMGRKQVPAQSLRHLSSECKVLAETGESGNEFAKNVNRVPRNTKKLRAATDMCEVCYASYDDPRGFAEDAVVPASIRGRVEAAISAKKAERAEARKNRGNKAATQKPKATGNKKAASAAARAKAARKRNRKPAAPKAAPAPVAASENESEAAPEGAVA